MRRGRLGAPLTRRNPWRRVAVLVSLKDCLTAAQADANVKAIVVTGANGKFSAGFDITHLAKQQAGGTQQDFGVDVNDFLIKLLEAGPKPTVAGAARSAARRGHAAALTALLRRARAAICDVALGGGLEVSMACNARVANKSAQLGLPELQLGACAVAHAAHARCAHARCAQASSRALAARRAFRAWWGWRRG